MMLHSVITAGSIRPLELLLCLGTAVLLGLGCSALAGIKNHCSVGLRLCLLLLPSLVMLVVMLVNGDLGIGLAVAGTFSLVRFRSAPGGARELSLVFLAMVLGLACGTGYLALALLFFAVMTLVLLLSLLLIPSLKYGEERLLHITIPEDLDYEGLFDDLLKQYTGKYELEKVKTSGMGTMFELSYRVTFPDNRCPKRFLDEIRCRNGNLNISVSRYAEREIL